MKLTTALFVLLPAFAFAAKSDAKNPLQAFARVQPSSVEAGGTVDLTIDLNLADHYHAYLDRFKLVIEAPDDLKLGALKLEPIVKFIDTVTKTEKEGIAGHAKLRTLIEVPVGYKAGEQKIAMKLTYQACTDDHCLFPKTIAVNVPLTIRTTK